MITILSRKYFSQFNNDEYFSDNLTDFTTNLVGAVLENLRVEIEVKITVISTSNSDNSFTVASGSITRITGNWIDDDWKAGDVFDFVDGAVDFNATIIALNNTELLYTLNYGTDTPAAYTAATMTIASDFLACVYKFGLNENADNSQDYFNKVDGSEQVFTATGINTSYSIMNPVPGAKSWITGDCRIKRGSLVAGSATYTIQHDFTILPYYLQEYQQAIIDGISPDEFFEGSNSLKYIFSVELRRVLSDPNAQHFYNEYDQLGSVGWYNENYNGFVNKFDVFGVYYQDTLTGDVVSGFQVDRKTTATIRITSNSLFSVASKVGAYVSAALDPADYAANPTLFKSLWLYDSCIRTVENAATLTGIIKRFDSELISSSAIDVIIDVEYSTLQQSQLSADQRFILAIQTATPDLPRDTGDMVMLLADFGTYQKSADVPGLMSFDDLGFIYHPMDESDLGYSNVRGWVEDGILSKLRFSLDIEIAARLRQLVFKLIARNSLGKEFIIQQYPFDLSSGILQPAGIYLKQAFNLDTTRGFPLPTGDFFNRVRLGEYIELNLIQWGEYIQDALIKTETFEEPLTSTYSLAIYDVTGVGPYILTEDVNGFETAASGAAPDAAIAYVAIQDGASITGIRGGTKNLVAGTNTITFPSLGNSDYTIFVFDKGSGTYFLNNMNASRTPVSFEITCTIPTIVTWVAVRNSGLSDIRSGSFVINSGLTSVSYSTDIDITTDYTLLVLDLENIGNIYNRNKLVGGFEISAIAASTGNYIAIKGNGI